MRYLPMAQTIWYVPNRPGPLEPTARACAGHYGRRTYKPDAHKTVPRPQAHWPDQEPRSLEGSYDERLNHWLTLVQRGEVLEAYRVFLGLFAESDKRPQLLAHLAFAGLIDVQIACCTTVPTPPATNHTARAPRSSWVRRLAGTRRMP